MSKKKIEKPDIFVISFMTNVTSFQEASIKIHASLLTPENKLKLFYPVKCLLQMIK